MTMSPRSQNIPPAALGYLDHAATTPVRPEAFEAMVPWLTDRFGNASGSHRLARAARRAVDDARDQIAAATGFAPGDLVFTGGGTEADNLAIRGVLDANPGGAVTVATEHPAVLRTVEAVGGTVVGVDRTGRVDLDRLRDALDEHTSIVSVMLVNNETGVIADLDAVAAVVRDAAPNALLHTDAIQAVCWVDVAAAAASADLLSLSAHKFGGPQGVGVLALRPDVVVRPSLLGGGQERNRRAGTHNVAGAVGTGAAIEMATSRRADEVVRLGCLRDRLVRELAAAVSEVVETAAQAPARVAGNAHLCFPGAEGEVLLLLLEDAGVSASAGSSCASGAAEPSHVLQAMGVDRTAALGSLRLTLGWTSTDADIDLAVAAIPPAVERATRLP